jgi:hypothetical protein
MVVRFVIFALIGKLLLYTFQKFPPVGWARAKWQFADKLFACDFCSGVWAYTILAFILNFNILEEWVYVIGFTEIITGTVTSFLVHLVSIGWNEKFRILYVE